MSWYDYTVGQRVPTEEVVAACERHVDEGGVIDADEKRRLIAAIRSCGHPVLVYDPAEPYGWGLSPMNPNAWKTPAGEPIVETA